MKKTMFLLGLLLFLVGCGGANPPKVDTSPPLQEEAHVATPSLEKKVKIQTNSLLYNLLLPIEAIEKGVGKFLDKILPKNNPTTEFMGQAASGVDQAIEQMTDPP